DRLEPNAARDLSRRRNLQSPNQLERRHDLAEMAVIAVVLVADYHDIRRFVDRLIPSRVGRSVGIEDDPDPFGLDQKSGVAVPGDGHGVCLLSPREEPNRLEALPPVVKLARYRGFREEIEHPGFHPRRLEVHDRTGGNAMRRALAWRFAAGLAA